MKLLRFGIFCPALRALFLKSSPKNLRKILCFDYENLSPAVLTGLFRGSISNPWGLLKAYAEKRNGWVKLSYTEKV